MNTPPGEQPTQVVIPGPITPTTLSPMAEPPVPGSQAGLKALRALLGGEGILAALESIHAEMGPIFRMPLPGFSPVFLVGPEANRFVTVTGREDLRWRLEGDPVTRLLNQGLLVTDGDLHDDLRHQITPSLHKSMLANYIGAMVSQTDQVTSSWMAGGEVDMLVEMRRLALLILVETLFGHDLNPHLNQLWPAILRTLKYISPGIWLVWPNAPRIGYAKAIREVDAFLYALIADRRRTRLNSQSTSSDLLGALIASGMPDQLIRDQLLTILIAGHDTSTALLAWSLYLLGRHPEALARVRVELDEVFQGAPPSLAGVSRLGYLDQVVNETLRLYPPIHIGNRRAAVDLEFQGYRIPAGTRVVYSIYLTHRMTEYWPDPARFDPGRFSAPQARIRPHYTFLPFGGGPRNCLGMAFAQVEVKVVLARLLQRFDLVLLSPRVTTHMGATLEPRPGVRMRVKPRTGVPPS